MNQNNDGLQCFDRGTEKHHCKVHNEGALLISLHVQMRPVSYICDASGSKVEWYASLNPQPHVLQNLLHDN